MAIVPLTAEQIADFQAQSMRDSESYYFHVETGALIRINQHGLENYKALTPDERYPHTKIVLVNIGNAFMSVSKADIIAKYGLTERHAFLLKRAAARAA